MTTTRHIRVIQDSDLPAILEIESAAFPDPWTEQMFRESLLNAAVTGWVACEGIDLVGYLLLLQCGEEGEVLNIATSARHRKQGIGSSLLWYAQKAAKQAGAKTIFLEVRRSNEVAQQLYRRCGFSQIGERRRYYRLPAEDALIYCCLL